MAAMQGVTGNPSSPHTAGRNARGLIEAARAHVANLVGATPKQIIFTSGATEANNTVLQHFKGRIVLTSATEHPSVIEAVPDAIRIPCHASGLINVSALQDLLAKHEGAALVSVMMVNNETGVIQPIAHIAAMAHAAGALMHTDAVQACGRIPVDMAALGVDYLTLTAHKFGGPQGVGALVVSPKAPPVRLLMGGGQERRQRAGTENVAAIAGCGEAARLALENLHEYQRLEALRDKLEAQLRATTNTITFFGCDTPRVANTSCFAFANVPAETQLMALDLAGFAVSSGSACSSGTVRASHVLTAMHVPAALASCALRLSLGWNTTEKDIDLFCETWMSLAEQWSKRHNA